VNAGATLVDPYGRPAVVEHKRATDTTEIARIFAKQDARSYRSGRPFRGNSWIHSIISDGAACIAEIPFGLWQARAATASKNYTPFYDEVFGQFLEKPNPLQTLAKFIQQWVVFYLAGGNVWAYIDDPRSTGLPRSLILFGIDSVSPVRQVSTMPPTAWDVRLPDGTQIRVPLDRMIHWGMPNDYDQWMGMPPWIAMDTQLDADRARVVFDRFFYENNATPDTILTYKPGPLNKQNRDLIYESWYDAYGGPDKHGGVAVVGGDFDIKVLGVTHSAAQFLENRSFTRQEAAAIYHYPVQLLNDIEGGGLGRDQLSVARMLKFENFIFPTANQFAKGITMGLVRPYIKSPLVEAYFDYDGLPVMIDFMKTKTDIFKTLVSSGIPINEAVAKLDMGFEPVEGGDVGYIASNLIELGKEAEDETDETEEEEEETTKEVEDARQATVRQLPPPATLSREELAPLLTYTSRKLKRFFFDVRNECFQTATLCFDVEKAKERFEHAFLPIYLGGIQAGLDLAAHRNPWIKNVNSIDGAMVFLRQHSRMMTDSGTSKQMALNLIHEFEPILVRLAAEINAAPQEHREHQVHQSFYKITDVAQKLARREIFRSIDCGRLSKLLT
jgi:HK97 family phage portal protein